MGRKIVTFGMRCVAYVLTLSLLPPVALYCVWRVYVAGYTAFFGKIPRPHRPPALDDPKHGEHGFIRKKNGLRLHYVARGPRAGPLLLLLHGFPQSWYSWRHQLQHLAPTHRVVALDLRGFGESDKPKEEEQYAMTEIAQDISETITYLGYKKCILAGHGLGGMVAMATATMYGHQVERLVLLSCPHIAVQLQQMTVSLEHLIKSLYLLLLNVRYVSEMLLESEDYRWLASALMGIVLGAKEGTYTSDDMEAVKYYMGNEGSLSASLNYYRTLSKQRFLAGVPTSNIYAPTLLLWGTGNFLLDPSLAALTKSRFIKHARIEYIQGASHWLQEEDPHTVNELIMDFLETENSQFYHDDLLVGEDTANDTDLDIANDDDDDDDLRFLDVAIQHARSTANLVYGDSMLDDSMVDSGNVSSWSADKLDGDGEDELVVVESLEAAKALLLEEARRVKKHMQWHKPRRNMILDPPSLELHIDYPVENLHRIHF